MLTSIVHDQYECLALAGYKRWMITWNGGYRNVHRRWLVEKKRKQRRMAITRDVEEKRGEKKERNSRVISSDEKRQCIHRLLSSILSRWKYFNSNVHPFCSLSLPLSIAAGHRSSMISILCIIILNFFFDGCCFFRFLFGIHFIVMAFKQHRDRQFFPLHWDARLP